MPTYDYVCTKCGHTFEAFQKMSDKPLTRCPECKGTLRRLIGGGMGIFFKGSGFYSTDNKRGSVLTGGNGNSKDSKDKEKPAEKAKEGAGDSSSSSSNSGSPTEKKAAS
jgi:putative FmdB family regulatory protein